MNFTLVDRVDELVSGKSIRAVKQVSMAEEYLADHFPGFPVLPGVMMLECAIEAAAWLIYEHTHFAPSLVILKEARQIRYGHFVSPGQTLTVTADVIRLEPDASEFKVRGAVGSATAIQGRITLAHIRLKEHETGLAGIDEKMIHRRKSLWETLKPRPAAAVSAGEG
ncbi:MAG: 3-hydroxyacyl-ACP dehydratase FabZ family protein [Phycisphaerae bacterium]